jgi:ferredoxin-fold anticodon binding domain-containing protein
MEHHSQRAQEVGRDLFAAIDSEVEPTQLPSPTVKFHLEASDVILSREEAEKWVRESVDDGFPNVQYYIERKAPDEVIVNLAAFEDSDSQYYP